jgi:hypothetical protein
MEGWVVERVGRWSSEGGAEAYLEEERPPAEGLVRESEEKEDVREVAATFVELTEAKRRSSSSRLRAQSFM